MKILAIETSCDETAIALLECSGQLPNPRFKVLVNSLFSQVEIHKEYGGVYPMLAKREHEKNLPILLEKTLKEAGTKEVDYIAVTVGPGLEPALWTGIVFAEKLSKEWNKPILSINHMEGHIWSVLACSTLGVEHITFPALALLVSGAHTELVLVKSFRDFEIIGRTRDDAVGEAFDKVARLLGLSYPGGPKLSKLAESHRSQGLTPTFSFPQPMLHSRDFSFSYSGLKTAVLYKLKEFSEINDDQRSEIAHAFEDAAIGVLIDKTKRALEQYGTQTLIVGGGVSANTFLRQGLETLAEEKGATLLLPPLSLTGDNAIMIGMASYIKLLSGRGETGTDLKASGTLSF